MLTSNEIIHITKEVALGIPPTLTSQEALNCRAITDQEKKMIEERGPDGYSCRVAQPGLV